MNPKVFSVVVVPTLINGAAFVAITTLGEDDNFVSKLKERIVNGKKQIIEWITISKVCDRCEKTGKAKTCKHKLGDNPPWHNVNREKDMEVYMQDDSDDFLREVKGVQANSNTQYVYDPKLLDKLLDETKDYSKIDAIPFVFVSVDPAAGGSRSRFAVSSCFYHEGTQVIVASENANYREPRDQMSLLINHIQKIKKIRGLEASRIVFAPESNLAFEGTHQRDIIQNSGIEPPVIVMYEDDNRAGIRTNNDLKKYMAVEWKKKLIKEKIKFHQYFFTLTEDYTVEKMKNEIISQLKNYARIIIPQRNPHIPPTEIYGGKNGYGFDDQVIVLHMNNHMKKLWYTNDKYKRFRD